MGSGCKDLSRGMESGGDFTTTAISESGWSPRHMATEFIPGKTEIDTKESGTCVSSTAQALTFFKTTIRTPENTRMESHTEKGSTLGKTGPLTLGISWVA